MGGIVSAVLGIMIALLVVLVRKFVL
jgi:hypothetical protein